MPKFITFPEFIWDIGESPKKLYLREKDNKFFLITGDGYFKKEIESTEELPFKKVSNISGVYFERDKNNWTLKSYNPLIEIK